MLTAFGCDRLFGGPMGIGKALAATAPLSLTGATMLIRLRLPRARTLVTLLAQPISSPPSTGSTMPVT